jgi:hypothetical protein
MAPGQTERRERLERAIVLQLLREDHGSRWLREELALELAVETLALEEALIRLDGAGVVHLLEDSAWASRPARALDELGLISV